jgi:hypothetical protein
MGQDGFCELNASAHSRMALPAFRSRGQVSAMKKVSSPTEALFIAFLQLFVETDAPAMLTLLMHALSDTSTFFVSIGLSRASNYPDPAGRLLSSGTYSVNAN